MSSTLPGCVASLQSSLDLLSSSIDTLDSGVNDFPRMTKVLQTTRHYELLPESTLNIAQSSLLSTLKPELDSMLSRVESYLDRLQRREAASAAKYELQAGRLASRRRTPATATGPATIGAGTGAGAARSGAGAATGTGLGAGPGAGAIGVGAGVTVGIGMGVVGGMGERDFTAAEDAREALRRKQIRQKKERLSYAVDRLTLQAQQKERQLRQSVRE